MRRGRHKALLLLALVAASASSIHSQTQQRDEQDEPLKLSTELVVVDAQVLSKKTGTPVNGLTERDFVVYEEGVKQQITSSRSGYGEPDRTPASEFFFRAKKYGAS